MIVVKFRKIVHDYDDAIRDLREDGIDIEEIKSMVVEWLLEDLPELIDNAEWNIVIDDEDYVNDKEELIIDLIASLKSAFHSMAPKVELDGEIWYDAMSNGNIEEIGDHLVELGLYKKKKKGWWFYRPKEKCDEK